MTCPKCQCYYDYKGEICLEDGQLKVKVALCSISRAVLERMVRDVTSVEKQKEETRKKDARKCAFKQIPLR